RHAARQSSSLANLAFTLLGWYDFGATGGRPRRRRPPASHFEFRFPLLGDSSSPDPLQSTKTARFGSMPRFHAPSRESELGEGREFSGTCAAPICRRILIRSVTTRHR